MKRFLLLLLYSDHRLLIIIRERTLIFMGEFMDGILVDLSRSDYPGSEKHLHLNIWLMVNDNEKESRSINFILPLIKIDNSFNENRIN